MSKKDYGRLSANELRIKYNNLIVKTKLLEKEIADRLLLLCVQFPNAPVKIMKFTNVDKNVTIYAKGFASKQAISYLSLDVILEYIEAIENYIHELHPHKQLKIDFDTDVNSK